MESQPSFIKDFYQVLFHPGNFFLERFALLSSRRIYALSFTGVFVGVLVGNLLTMFFTRHVLKDFATNIAPYMPVLDALSLSSDNFAELLKAQYAHSVVLACLSPVIAYCAPHILGGALFIFMWLLYRPNNQFEFHRVMECAAISLTSSVFYLIPGFGPAIALIILGVNLSRAITAHFKLTGFFKVMSIISALYLCFFLMNATFQLLSLPMADFLNVPITQ